MNKLTLTNKAKYKKIYKNRANCCLLFAFCCFGILIINLFYLQIVHFIFYKQSSENNRLNIDIIPPLRGKIIDRNNKILAYEKLIYTLDITNKKNIRKNVYELAKLLNLSKKQAQSFLNKYNSYAKNTLKSNLTPQEIARLSVQLFKYPNAKINVKTVRIYPYHDLLAQTLGYVAPPTASDLKKKPDLYKYAMFIGKTGIEKSYNSLLQGTIGYQKIETNALGKTIQNIHNYPATPGDTLQLTIDINLQRAAAKAFGVNNGAIIITQPKTGDILALSSHPSYDLNYFINKKNSNDYKDLYNNPNNPLFNRALRGQYPPGSTIKPIISLYALDNHFTTPKEEFFDKGWFQIPGSKSKYRDWKRNGHGWLNISDAIIQSCSTFFYHLAYKIGINNLSQNYKNFGFNNPVVIDLPGERTGLIPSRAWKEKVYHKNWYIGETLISGIGQGYVMTTPIQLANMVTMLSNHGQYIPLHIIKMIEDSKNKPIPLPSLSPKTIQKKSVFFSKKTWALVLNAMHKVTSTPRGTAFKYFRTAPYKVAGKTGTAQVSSITSRKDLSSPISKLLRDNTLFIGFTPIKNPEISIIVLLENAHGASAIARKIFDFYYKYKKEKHNALVAHT